jgi:hypothetical protein
VTEQIERELTELFHDRAERLDVRPAPRPAQIRRARLQAGLALASVLAVLAGVMLTAARLADGGPDRPITVTATGQQAMADLMKALRRTLSGREVATTTIVEVPNRKYLDAPDLGYGAAVEHDETYETKYDGTVGDVETTSPETRFVHDVLYRKPDRKYLGHGVPASTEWVRYTRDAESTIAQWRDLAISSAIPGLFALYATPGPIDTATEQDGQIRVTSPDLGGMRFVIKVQLDGSGRVSTLTSRFILSYPNAVTDRVARVTFRQLGDDSLRAEPPVATSVISGAEYDAAKKAYDDAHRTCTTTPPSTGPDGTKYGPSTTCSSGEGSTTSGGATVTPSRHSVAVTPAPAATGTPK